MKIKYRIWDKKYRRWNTGRPSMDRFFVLIDRYSLEFNSDRYIIQISTGKFDIHGVEIYEGDIVKYDFIDDCFGRDSMVGQIKEVKCNLSTNIDPISSGGPDGEDRFENIEVIGNIFKNKELLT